MKKEDEWIREYDCLTINSVKYWFRCVLCLGKKTPNSSNPSMQLTFAVYREGLGWLSWDDFRGSYLEEKLTDYIQNSINGQRAVYWDNSKGRSFGQQ